MTFDDLSGMRRGGLGGRLAVYAVTGSVPEGKEGEAAFLVDAVDKAIRGGATFVQLRDKGASKDVLLKEAISLAALCAKRGVPFVVNDDVQVAHLSGSDGVHVGQGDMSLRQARAVLGEGKIIGVSCQTVDQAREAEAGGADYLGVGAVFATPSKVDAHSVSLETLEAICRAVAIPVVAIGGITADNVRLLQGTGVAGVAVISAIFGAADIEEAARELSRQVRAHLN